MPAHAGDAAIDKLFRCSDFRGSSTSDRDA
jgi:hypothetical protein